MAVSGRENQTRFPITLWPGAPLQQVEVERWVVLASEKGTLSWRTRREPAELPGEWVLRKLGKADLSDDEVVLDLLDQFGIISWPYFDRATIPRELWCRLATLADDEEEPNWWSLRNDGTLEDARWWLCTARALAGVWYRAQCGEPPAAAWTDEGFIGITTDSDAWTQFVLALNAGLFPFRAHAEYLADFRGLYQHRFGRPHAGLYSAAVCQVFNLIIAEDAARRCERCGVIFVHQLGGAVAGQYRSTGVQFCSPSCARAEMQRRYRIRQKLIQKGSK